MKTYTVVGLHEGSPDDSCVNSFLSSSPEEAEQQMKVEYGEHMQVIAIFEGEHNDLRPFGGWK